MKSRQNPNVCIGKVKNMTKRTFRYKKKPCDVIIYVQDKSFRCHRSILVAKSDYFRAIFDSHRPECYAIHVLRGSIDAPTFSLIAEFMYTNQVKVNHANFLKLAVASEYLRMPSMEELCADYIRGKRRIRNAVKVFKTLRKMNSERMTAAICDYIVRNFRNISKTAEFFSLQFNDFCLLLDAYEFKDISHWEEMFDNVKLDVIMKWIRHDRDNRLSYFDDLVTKHLVHERVDFNYCLHVWNKLFNTVPRFTDVFTSSDDSSGYHSRSDPSTPSKDSSMCVPRSDPSLRVFVAFQDRSIGVFASLDHEDDWRLSCTLSNRDYGFQRQYSKYYRGDEFVILKNVLLDDQFYCVMSEYDSRGKEQTFCRASSMDLKQNFQALSLSSLEIRGEFEMCTSQNNIYLCTYNSDNYFYGEMDDQEPGQGLYLYERERDEWFPVSPRSRKVLRACMAADDNALYLIGNDYLETFRAHLFAYDSRPSHQWRKLGPAPFETAAVACCVHKGELYANGGWTGMRKTHIFDPRAGRWREAARNIYSDRLNHRLLSYRDRVWAIGGDNPSLNIEVYDPVSGKWSVDESLDNFSTIVEEYPYKVLDAFVFDPN